MSLDKLKEEWEDLAIRDPFWAILSDPKQRFNKWDTDDFFSTGKKEIDTVMKVATTLDYPKYREKVLDFGCGVGRLTRALNNYFKECIGVDIAENMILKARELNTDMPNCHFLINTEKNLKIFDSNSFDMIYTSLVLQHLQDKSIIKSYIIEFIRTLKVDGLLIFQLPAYIPLIYRLQLVRKLFLLLKFMGFKNKYLYEKLKLFSISMSSIPKKEVVSFLKSNGVKVLEVQEEKFNIKSNQSVVYYVTK
ncbi:MAG: class I SAM-dependent methyltransferase [Patescibacteria group bacterium]|jgi:ubiquinone/menaquinone biosynthesis C-methylase UbiE